MTTKTAKIRKMLQEGKGTSEIVASLKVRPQTVYGVRYYDKQKIRTAPTVWQRIKSFLGVK